MVFLKNHAVRIAFIRRHHCYDLLWAAYKSLLFMHVQAKPLHAAPFIYTVYLVSTALKIILIF